MSTIIRLIKWLWRAWPIVVLAPLIGAHLLLLSLFPQSAVLINKSIALITQLIGGLLILYSIDSNIGIIKQKSLFLLFANYFKEFPLVNRSTTIELQGASMAITGGKAKLSVGRNPQNIEEKIRYLQEQINEMKQEFEQETKDIHERIDRQTKEMNVKIQETNSALKNLESKMDEVSTGGIKPQLFGVLLMIYGAVSGYAA